ncbi:MAG: cupin domain-containing protein [Sphingobacteriales bacterium]|nr:MAG: cupin domain-containing protein [Sphingobacteriales bacterium]
MKDAQFWVSNLKLEPHPEGGYFKETYRSAEIIPKNALPNRFFGERNFSTSIYFLLEGSQFSALHRIESDEVWHFYDGTALSIFVIYGDGNLQEITLGNNPENGEVLQAVVPHGAWFGSRVKDKTGFALVGCTVAPGFDFEDFEMAERKALLEQFPQHSDIIHQLTHS